MERHIRGEGLHGETVFHAIEVAPDRWHWSGADYAGVMIATRRSLITQLANMIGEGKIYCLTGPGLSRHPDLARHIDRAGNMWLGRDYLAPHQYLPDLIPEASDGSGPAE